MSLLDLLRERSEPCVRQGCGRSPPQEGGCCEEAYFLPTAPRFIGVFSVLCSFLHSTDSSVLIRANATRHEHSNEPSFPCLVEFLQNRWKRFLLPSVDSSAPRFIGVLLNFLRMDHTLGMTKGHRWEEFFQGRGTSEIQFREAPNDRVFRRFRLFTVSRALTQRGAHTRRQRRTEF